MTLKYRERESERERLEGGSGDREGRGRERQREGQERTEERNREGKGERARERDRGKETETYRGTQNRGRSSKFTWGTENINCNNVGRRLSKIGIGRPGGGTGPRNMTDGPVEGQVPET